VADGVAGRGDATSGEFTVLLGLFITFPCGSRF